MECGISGLTRSLLYRIEKVAQQAVTPISIRDMMRHAKACAVSRTGEGAGTEALVRAANWIQRELPVRLAHRLYDFNRLPYVVTGNEHIHRVYSMYADAFEKISGVGNVRDERAEAHFARTLARLVSEHAEVTSLMQKGVVELRASYPDIALDRFLDRLFNTRIGNRLISEHYLAVREDHFRDLEALKADPPSSPPSSTPSSSPSRPSPSSRPSDDDAVDPERPYVGIIHQQFRPAPLIQAVADRVSQIGIWVYGRSPQFELEGDLDLSFSFIPEHVKFILFEIMKNSMRATVENHLRKFPNSDCFDESIPKVRVRLHKGHYDVMVKVSDEGGGMESNLLKNIWRYGYTTVGHQRTHDSSQCTSTHHQHNHNHNHQQPSPSFLNPLNGTVPPGAAGEAAHGSPVGGLVTPKEVGGYGFGLPLSRLYCRYFGGDLNIHSVAGYGTDTYILLNRLGDQRENELMLNYWHGLVSYHPVSTKGRANIPVPLTAEHHQHPDIGPPDLRGDTESSHAPFQSSRQHGLAQGPRYWINGSRGDTFEHQSTPLDGFAAEEDLTPYVDGTATGQGGIYSSQ
ncbi:unnamed protein product [Vitrella brassicaformis CCMP3155]|uniref:Protein-serine/threonine kinase n=2 Tax=Vitrella brassicaformis TaxID=1169539 RepID=A0A0G4F838_VITBC|nr:unnamed protein product [Vitrella brassicaformis CCMP3155]|mmetsp:Transcript_20166/g.48943  ORF Transcript_20166/g.48943 Transcript_20166/m.48943 type:complete len:571 (+) Transcript_20166:149-1861(+)|eukprot:CEM08869.1 unnamed protein product [Vitrella brassicaformis CCMP3155]